MNLADVMDDLGSALEGIPKLRVFPYYADKVNPPAAVVAWPDPLTFDATMGRGSDRQEFPLIVLVGRVDTRSARDQVAQYAAGSGTHSVKQAVETYQPTAYDSARVDRAEFGVITVGGVDYLAATFYVDIIGTGA